MLFTKVKYTTWMGRQHSVIGAMAVMDLIEKVCLTNYLFPTTKSFLG